MDFSPALACEIVEMHQMELRSKSDKLFIDGVYKLCRDVFAYVPKLRREQFFQLNYSVAKAYMAVEIIELVKKHVKNKISVETAVHLPPDSATIDVDPKTIF
jgi:hypothetical protein